jgi:uncharacterized protein
LTLVVMTKLPVPGQVKTRLMPALSPQQAAQLHAVMLRHVASRLAPLGELVICHDPPEAEPALRDLLGIEARYIKQCSGDLGARLVAASRELGSDPLMFFAVDSPDVPLTSVMKLTELLGRHEIAIGPCEDGGYWCLGVRREVDVDALLKGIEWSSGRELAQTIGRAGALGYRVGVGDPWYDVDRPQDLRRLVSRLRTSDNDGDMQLLNQLSFLPHGVLS